ncbi:MAG: leucyl aminopeptidase [Saprospiraceae bacterium]|nr:leucyl aminopeptidase [Saprospiraceae bacterium]
MSLHIKSATSKKANNVLITFPKDGVDQSVIRKYSGLGYDAEHTGASRELISFLHPENKKRIHILGLGEPKEASKMYTLFRSFVFQQRSKSNMILDVIGDHLSDDELKNAVIGLTMGMINHGIYKTNGNKYVEPEINLVVPKSRQSLAEDFAKVVDTQMSVMNLVDQPSNIKFPAFIGQHALKSGKKYGYNVKVLEAAELKKMGMDALLAVGQGSNHPPVFIIMEYKPKGSKSKSPKLGLVGKGISFDSGGLSIKPAANMGYMKSDMAGAGAVIGALELAARLKLDIHLVGIVPSAENSVDAKSLRPGDVISSYSGKSIEVIDTDAEGRLVLADGLSYIKKHFDPEYIIDLATLTGSCIATLGNAAAGLFTHSDEMAHDLTVAGDEVNERVWRLPLWEDYLADMQSDIADIKNLSGKPVAGAITAAKFLEFFISEHQKWAHLDIAGMAFTDSEFAKMRTATAYGVRLLLQYMQKLIS